MSTNLAILDIATRAVKERGPWGVTRAWREEASGPPLDQVYALPSTVTAIRRAYTAHLSCYQEELINADYFPGVALDMTAHCSSLLRW